MSLDIVWIIISYFGDVQYWLGLTIAMLIVYQLLDKRDKHKLAWVLLALLPAVIVSAQITMILKDTLLISRPCIGLPSCIDGYSFPSGHATVMFAFASVVVMQVQKRGWHLLVVPLAVLVSVARVALGYHTVADVAAGAAIGISVGYLFHRSYRSVHVYFERKRLVA